MLRLGAGELMPLILNEDDVHALRPAASPCSGCVRDSTNCPPWARCEAPGRARRPPRPPSPPEDTPLGSRTGTSAKATPWAPLLGGTSALLAEGSAGWGMSPRTAEASETWHFRACSGEGCFTLIWERMAFPTGTRDLRSPLPMSVSSVPRGGGRGQLPRVSLAAGRPAPRCGDGARSGGDCAERGAGPQPVPGPALGAEIEM